MRPRKAADPSHSLCPAPGGSPASELLGAAAVPLVISSATRIPFLLVLFGVVLAAFGLVGLFVGPVILAVIIAVWQEWLEESEAGAAPERPAR